MRWTTLHSMSLVGRSADLERLSELVGEGACLVTITGTGGVGKTVLAARFAEGLKAGGAAVGFCDLSEARDAAAIRSAVARTLGIAGAEGAGVADIAAQVARALTEVGPLVLVLDNFEQLVRHAEETIAVWLADIPELQILVTSRERLRLPGEIVHQLAPLAVPERDDATKTDAVELWVDRVRAIHPSYVLTPEEAPVVARLVRELDGLPLAIELAAARFGAATPAELLERLEQRIDALPRIGRSQAGKSTLRETIDWSWALLEPHEREALAQCAAFRGRITLDAAEAVLRVSGASESSVLDVIQALRDKSLLVHPRSGDAGSAPALTMYTSVRKYAEEKLAELAEGPRALDRHARYFVEYAERCAVLAQGSPAEASRRLDAERENLEAVLRRGLASSSVSGVSTALRLLPALAKPNWYDASSYVYLQWFDEALAHPLANDVPPRILAQARIARGRVAWRVGRIDGSLRDLEEAVVLAVRANDIALECLARRFLGLTLLVGGRLDESRRSAEQALSLALRIRDRRLEGFARQTLGYGARMVGDQRGAQRSLEQALDCLLDVGDSLTLGIRIELLHVHLDGGELDAARVYAAQALAEARALGLPPPPNLLLGLGHAALEDGRPGEALVHYREAREGARAIGELALEGCAAACEAVALFDEGRAVEARLLLRETWGSAERYGGHLYKGLGTAMLAAFEAALGHVAEARDLLAVAATQLEGEAQSPYRIGLVVGQGFLDLAEARRARARGDDAAAAANEERARNKLEAILSREGPVGWIAEVRIFARLLRSAVATVPPRDTAARRVLRIEAEGRWFEPPGSPKVSCATRPVMRRLLLALARSRLGSSPRPLSVSELVQAAWPGERMPHDAAKNRLHVMITRMRSHGLREILVGTDQGYSFAADVAIQLV
jgi:predicted ATPase